MTITKILIRKLFITALFMLNVINSNQLHAMNPKIDKNNYETVMDKDFQVYKLLSSLNNNHEWYLPTELVQTIATNTSKLIDKKCYKKYEIFFSDTEWFLIFIQHNTESISHTPMMHIIKRCLRHSGKSLGEITNSSRQTIFHLIPCWSLSIDARLNWIKAFKDITGNEKAWNMICIQDTCSFTPLTWSLGSHPSIIQELLSTAPNIQETWNLIMTPDKTGRTTLDRARQNSKSDVVQLLESYNPQNK